MILIQRYKKRHFFYSSRNIIAMRIRDYCMPEMKCLPHNGNVLKKGTPLHTLQENVQSTKWEVAMNYAEERTPRNRSGPAVSGEHGFLEIRLVSQLMYLNVFVLLQCAVSCWYGTCVETLPPSTESSQISKNWICWTEQARSDSVPFKSVRWYSFHKYELHFLKINK